MRLTLVLLICCVAAGQAFLEKRAITSPVKVAKASEVIEGSGDPSVPALRRTPLPDMEIQGSGGGSPDDEDGDDVEGSGDRVEGSGAPVVHTIIEKPHSSSPALKPSSSSTSTSTTTTTTTSKKTTAVPAKKVEATTKPTTTTKATTTKKYDVLAPIEKEVDDRDKDDASEDSAEEDERPKVEISEASSTRRPPAALPPTTAEPPTPFHAMLKPGIFAAVVGGTVVGLLTAILLVMFIVYRMRKKDEGSYALEEPKQRAYPGYAYTKASSTKEFYA